MFSGAEPFVQLFRGHFEEQCCEFISKLGQWFRWHLKDFLSGALSALLLSGAEPFMQFEREHHGEHPCEVILTFE